MRDRLAILLVLASIVAAVSQTPVAWRFEEDTGLGLLYRVRGAQEAPEGAVVIALDDDSVNWMQRNSARLETVAPGLHGCIGQEAAARLARARTVTEIPRSIFACLVREVSAGHPKLMVFDVHFALPQPDDALLASEIEKAGNVLLFERVEERKSAGAGSPLLVRRRPAEALTRAALGTIGFHVESAPGRVTTHYRTRIEGFPDLPVMPVEAYRRTVDHNTRLGEREMFWLYGPPWTVPTYALRDIFEPGKVQGDEFRDQVVFVGVSGRAPEARHDGFAVPAFARSMSGVELAATAYLNLRHDQRLTAPGTPGRAAVAGGMAIALGAAALMMSGWLGIGAVLVIAAGAAGGAVAAFSQGVWLPILVPLLVSLPLIGLVALDRRLRLARYAVQAVLPRSVSAQMLEGHRADPRKQMTSAVFVDIVGSTGLAERCGPETYTALLAWYYRTVSEAVDRAGGVIYEFQGDGILALFFASETGGANAGRACEAALSIRKSVSAGPAAGDLPQVTLRIGISTGPIMAGVLSFGEHVSISAMGDAVNRAARLQEMGREVPQDHSSPDAIILVDDETIERASLPEGTAKHFKTAVLRGRTAPTTIYRLSPERQIEGAASKAGEARKKRHGTHMG